MVNFRFQNIDLLKRARTFVQTKNGRFIVDLCIVTMVSIVLFRNFILSSGWPGGGDTLGWISREYLFGRDFRWLYVWRPYSFGFVEEINSLDFFFMLINSICQDGAVTTKFFMFFTVILAGFSMYAFAYHHTRNNLASLSASLVYSLNRWHITQLTEGHVGILFGYALAPLLFLLLDRALKYGRLKDMAMFAVTLCICLTGANPLSTIIYMFFLVLFTVFYLLTPQSSFHFWNRMKRFLKVLAFSGVITLFLSAFFIIPFIYNVRAPFYSVEFGYGLEEAFAISYGSMSDAFVLRGVEQWGYIRFVDVTSEVSLQIIPISLILFGIFLIAYLTVLIKTDRYTLYFLVSSVISMFLAKGPHPPYGNIFTWAWLNIPHFSIFRAANRFAMMTAFSHAFFISILVSIITGYISTTRSSQTKEAHLEINVRTSPPKDSVQKQILLFKPLNKALKRIKNFLYYFFTLLLILILLSGFFSCWFFFQNGLQTYTPPENFISPYRWIANQPQDFKIVTALNSPAEWKLLPDAQTDFGSSAMLTRLGWGHDISFDSSFIHDKPVLGDGGHVFKSRQFVDYLRFGIARKYLSDKLLKLLGTFDYKYVVLPPYASENIRSFFINQEGAQVVYNQSGSVILENTFYNPRISSASSYMLVVGGVKSFFTASKINIFNSSRTAFVFTDQFENSNFLEETVLNGSKAILFDDNDLLDLVMLSSEDMNVIHAEHYAIPSRNYSAYWGISSSWQNFGVLTLGRYTLTTCGKNRVSIPFEVVGDGDYEIMVRVAFSSGRGGLAVHVDGSPIERVRPSSDDWTNLKWINLGSLYLEEGNHEISLTNDGTGWNDVDAVAVVKSSILENQIKQVLNRLQSYPGRIVHILSAAHTFSHHIPSEWHMTLIPYEGDVLESNSPSTFLATNTTILREGQYMFAIRLAQGSDQGTPQLQVDNRKVAIRHLSSSSEVEWYEGGPVYLSASSHLIEVGASGKIGFDQMLVYSLKDEEKVVSLDGFQFHTEELGSNVSPEGNASASSVETERAAHEANDGDPNTRWASKPGESMPQWLQIEWATPQELVGVHILFEWAYAEDYVIQTWNGTQWVNQVNVTGNNQLNPLHYFEQTVTTKLRIYVTSAPAFNTVSIWELEAYATQSVSRTVLIPQDGFYRVAFRSAFGPDYGTLNLTLNNATTTVPCNSSIPEIKLYEVGAFYLHSGKQNVTLSATGKVDFDEMVMTLNDEEDFGFLDDVFEAKPGPHVSYEKMNPCKYEAHIENNNEPFLLVFSESYHPMWKANVDDEEISPISIYSIVNGFYINKTGNFNVTIYFTGQTYAEIGLKISAITLAVTMFILIIPSKIFKKVRKRIQWNKIKSHVFSS